MTAVWAYVFEHAGTDPRADRTVIDRNGQRTLLVPVPAAGEAPRVAVELVEEGVELIELCGGFTLPAAAAVAEAVAGRVPVGHVTFALDSVPGVAAYSAQFAAGQAAPG